jgi:hypothetical protein
LLLLIFLPVQLMANEVEYLIPTNLLVDPSPDQREGSTGVLRPEYDDLQAIPEDQIITQYIPWSLAAPRQSEPDWKGLSRDSAYILGLHWAIIGLLYVAPESVSGWTADQKDANLTSKWTSNVQTVVWDKDDPVVNYVLHPYWGATYYARGRERGLSPWGAFGFSALHSTLYEFGTEALFEEPSIQDLIVTPVLGSLLGMYFEKVRDKIKLKALTRNWKDNTVLVLTDPLGSVSHQLDRLFRVDTRIKIQTRVPNLDQYANGPGMAKPLLEQNRYSQSGDYLGVSVKLVW